VSLTFAFLLCIIPDKKLICVTARLANELVDRRSLMLNEQSSRRITAGTLPGVWRSRPWTNFAELLDPASP
jgi:hypothetical protein